MRRRPWAPKSPRSTTQAATIAGACVRLQGTSTRWSTHATARGFDVRGFTLATGDRSELRDAWDDPAIGGFLRDAQTGACDVFGLVLGPNYNALHADHFHIQTTGNGCL